MAYIYEREATRMSAKCINRGYFNYYLYGMCDNEKHNLWTSCVYDGLCNHVEAVHQPDMVNSTELQIHRELDGQ